MRSDSRRHGRGRTRSEHHRASGDGRGPEEGRAFGGPGRRPKGLVWTGTISFGLVNIPVSLHSGESAKELHFTMLDRRDMSPVGYRKINKNTGADVPPGQIVKGYRLEDDRYVTLSEEDFKRASPERTQRIEIRAFVDGSRINPAHFDRPYYLEPAARSEKAYALLREALRRSGKVGIATVVLRARERLGALIVQGPVLTLELLRYASELRDPRDLRLPAEDARALKISESELQMAERLIAELSGPWRPESFKDEYHDELLAFIERKAKAGKTEAARALPSRPARGTPPTDIMALLKKSLAQRPKAHA